MAGLAAPAHQALEIVARLQQGVVMDLRYGIALDGLLMSSVRSAQASDRGVTTGSLLDGGLSVSELAEWDIPLGRCDHAGAQDWHWLATTGMPVNSEGTRVSGVPDAHRLLGDLDERRAEQVAVALPKNVGGSRGRYRRRVTPVLTLPATAVVWRAIGDLNAVQDLLSFLPTVGGRRGSGEGSVIAWEVREADPNEDPWSFAHLHPDGVLGRPAPLPCAERLHVPTHHQGVAGLRPPMFHSGRQQVLVLPDLTSTKGSPDAA
jgi:CRISPR type IV-associated protein Csf3